MMTNSEAHWIHVVDQSIASISDHLDRHVDECVRLMPNLGFQDTVGRLTVFWASAARDQPAAVAGLLALAITRLATLDDGGPTAATVR